MSDVARIFTIKRAAKDSRTLNNKIDMCHREVAWDLFQKLIARKGVGAFVEIAETILDIGEDLEYPDKWTYTLKITIKEKGDQSG